MSIELFIPISMLSVVSVDHVILPKIKKKELGMEGNTEKQFGFVSQLQRQVKRIVLIVKQFLKRL